MVIFAGIIVQMLFAMRRHFEADASYHLSTWLPRNEATPSSASQESAVCLGAWDRELGARPQEQLKSFCWLVRWASDLGLAELVFPGFRGHMSIPSFQVSPVSQLRGKVRLWG